MSDDQQHVFFRHVLGVLVDRGKFVDGPEFSWLTWTSLLEGPLIIRPRRYGNYEPLQPINALPPEKVIPSSFFFSNGRKSQGSVFISERSDRRFYNFIVNLTGKKNDKHAEDVYQWLEATFPYTYCYLFAFSKHKIAQYPEAVELMRIGVFEHQIVQVLEHRHVFEHFETIT